MKDMARLFKGIFTITELKEMPLRMVYTLRDIRIKELEEEQKQASRDMGNDNPKNIQGTGIASLSDMEEFLEDLPY
jgi:hypothetical protein